MVKRPQRVENERFLGADDEDWRTHFSAIALDGACAAPYKPSVRALGLPVDAAGKVSTATGLRLASIEARASFLIKSRLNEW